MDCGGSCVLTASDAKNCGSCGHACGTGASCVNATCTCPVGQSLCNGACNDTQSDAHNCGTCGTACGTGSVC
jgi:hypothetical protein